MADWTNILFPPLVIPSGIWTLEENGDPLIIAYNVGGIVDHIPPVIALVSPPLGTSLGASDTITVDITDETSLRDVWIYTSMAGEREVVWGGDLEGFAPRYAVGSIRSAISGGWRYALKRKGGWFSNPTFHVLAIDQGGNQT